MNHPVNTRSYDLFKAIVALILFIILIWLLLSGAASPATPVAVAPAASNTATSATQVQPTATSQPVQPNATPIVEPTETILPTPTPTEAPATTVAAATEQTPTETHSAAPEATAAPSETEAPAAESDQTSVDCSMALPTHLKVGDTARVTSNLNMRVDAGISKSLILTNPSGTQLTIIGGPVCESYQDGAYLWWEVSRSDEQTGWSAEGSLTDRYYFLEPIE
jgi:hypothetical protein